MGVRLDIKPLCRARPYFLSTLLSFGLTPAEAEMTARLANGESLEAIAEARNVCVDTVRTQLRTVFKKTGTHRQGELVCAVGRLAVVG